MERKQQPENEEEDGNIENVKNRSSEASNNLLYDANETPILCSMLGPTNSSSSPRQHQQVQSGCLYIHGTYPYSLAQLLIAGSDASAFSYSNHKSNKDIRTLIIWDNVKSLL
eukprot:9274859-Ditylum_brightwellii.AAC.1